MGNGLEIIGPIMAARARKAKEASHGTTDQPMSKAELEYTLETYDPLESTIEDFTTISIELGYVVLFACAFPIAPVLAFLSEYCQVRTDGWKLCRAFRRCKPVGAQDIGIWKTIFELTSYAAVLSNAGIVCFTMDILDGMSLAWKVWLFILFQYFLLSIMVATSVAIPDTPEDVIIQTDRTKFFETYIIDEQVEEDDKIDFSTYQEKVELHQVKPSDKQEGMNVAYYSDISELMA